MKNTNKIAALCFGLLAIQTTHPFSVSDTWNQTKAKAQSGYQSAKTTAQSGYQNAKQGWENLDESTKNAILGGTIATAGTAAAAGAAYGGYKAYEGQNSSNYGTGPSFEEIVNKRSLNNDSRNGIRGWRAGQTVGEEASELWAEKEAIRRPTPPQVPARPAVFNPEYSF